LIFEKIIEIEKYYDWESIFRGSLINVTHIIAGMICRYFLEFGEVSNTYNFTLPNIAIHIVAISCICICGYLHEKKQIEENKEAS
jgi:hypothetical protein